MDRLTGRDNIGVYYRHGAESGLHPYADRPAHDCKEAIERLAAYEDTGHTPEEFARLWDIFQDAFSVQGELVQARAERDAAVKDIETIFERQREYADSDLIDGVEMICDLCACWQGDGVKSCHLDCKQARWRGTEAPR